MKTAGGYARRQFSVRSAVTGGEEFALLRVDAEALDAFLARGN
jgi:hypothetical protein